MPREAELQARAGGWCAGRGEEWSGGRPGFPLALRAVLALRIVLASVRRCLARAWRCFPPARGRRGGGFRIAIGFIFMVTVVIVTIVVTINIVVAVVIIISIDGCGEYASSPAFRLPVFVMGGGGDGGGKTGYPLYELQGSLGYPCFLCSFLLITFILSFPSDCSSFPSLHRNFFSCSGFRRVSHTKARRVHLITIAAFPG